MSEMNQDSAVPFDRFELIVAILLGLAAIGAAWASLQSGGWGGKQLQAFAEANAITTNAAKSYSEAVSDLNSDYMVVGQAKRLIIEGIDADTDAGQQRSYKLASYYLTQQLGQAASDALKIPNDSDEAPAAAATTAPPAAPAATTATDTAAEGAAEGDDEEEGEGEAEAATDTQPAAAAQTAAATPAAADDGDADTEEEVEAELANVLPESTLIQVLGTELHDDDGYENAMFAEGEKLFADADKKFAEGRTANDNGDKYDLAGLFFTIALFFAGLALVFKSSMRWAFCGSGALIFLGTLIYMLTLPGA
jgi:hypothetical protein